MSFRAEAITKLRPNAKWTMRGDTITWEDKDQTEPTEKEIDAEIKRLNEEYEKQAYARSRAVAFPSWQEQLDMQYWDKVNGTNKWQEAVGKVKADNPKPE